MQRPANLQDPQILFADPIQDQQKITEKDLENMQKNYNQFVPVVPQPQVQNFKELNNAQNFQLQNFQNELNLLKNKVQDMEKRLAQLMNTQQAPPPQLQFKPPQQSPQMQQQAQVQFRPPQQMQQQVPQQVPQQQQRQAGFVPFSR